MFSRRISLCVALALLGAVAAAGSARVPPAGLPDQIDLRPTFINWSLPVRGQGARGTCSAFVITQAIEYAVATRDRQAAPLSVEFLNWASNQAVNKRDDGGFFSDLWKGFEAYGLCPDADLPYQSAFNPDLSPSLGAIADARRLREHAYRLHWIKPWDVKTGLTDEHVDQIKQVLTRQWPVCGGFRWPKATRWDGDLLEWAPADGVRDGHSVLLVGYRDDPALPGGGAFIFRNSSLPDRDGRMTYAYAKAYMNDAAWIDFDAQVQPATASKAAAPGLPDILNPAGVAPAGRNRRVSSNQQPSWHDENLDMTWLQPGQSIEMPLLEGPGVITHMWFTSHAGWAGELNALSMRIYWDDHQTPGVEAPLGDFFAVGQGKPATVESIPVQVSTTGSLSSYWRMPFHKSARIVITNDNPDRGAGLYWQVDWMQVASLPADTPLFHARYRQQYPAKAGDYTLAELSGRGAYVGSVMSITSAQDGWYGEGDDFFYIDGETVPSLQGTGSEDYFNDAWGFRPRTSLWFGSPRWQGDSAGDSGVCYRWHIADAVNFSTSLRFDIEHKGNHNEDTEGFYVERPDFLSSVAFWYQTGEPAAWPALPGWHDRRIPWQTTHFVRMFQQAKVEGHTGDKGKPRIDTSSLFGARPVLLWPASATGAQLTLPFEVAKQGRHAVRLIGGTGPRQAPYDILIDGKKISAQIGPTAEDGELDLLLGTHELAQGSHTISFKPAWSKPDQAGPLAVEMIRLLPLPAEARREVKSHNEAHFVRLAIGRAAYAYRLAYDKLPDSLQVLVNSGILRERYLRDENNQPLKSRREGDYLVVESTGPLGKPWAHRWQGLDARR